MLIMISRTHSLASIIEELKKSSSKWIKSRGSELHDFNWQKGYGAFSVSCSNLKKVEDYILSQQEHHNNLSFEEEYKFFLEKHKIEYDELYLWS